MQFDRTAYVCSHSASQQALVKGEESLVDLKNVVVPVSNEILYDDVELAGMGKGKASLLQHLPGLLQRQFQCRGKGYGGRLGGLVVDIRADLGEQFTVDVGLFVALGVGDPGLVDLPQQHLGKALVQFAEGFVQIGRGRDGSQGIFLHGHGGQSHSAALDLPVVGVCIHIAVVDIGGNVGKQFPTDGVGSPVEDDQIHRHVGLS